jgi:hypothetical protein
MDGYPFAKLEYSINDVLKLYYNLKTNRIIKIDKSPIKIKHYKGETFDTVNFNGKPITIVVSYPYTKYKYEIIWLTDYFQEKSRVQCNSERHGSMLNTFNNLKKQGPVTRCMLLDNIKTWCGVYPINVAHTIYKMFKPKRILDMSSGWGDRLIAATMYDPELYVGVDPNKSLFSGYKNIIDAFAIKKEKYVMINDAFEDANITGMFDLMFSCPPFFIAEKYSSDEKQSFNRYNDIDNWLNNFMYVSIRKIWSHLNRDGYLIIDINDTKVKGETVHFVEKINRYIDSFTTSEYQGVIKWKYNHKNHANPIWVWKKI